VSEAEDRAEWASFRRLWFGQTVSQVGTAVTVVALPLVAVLQLHASALDVGIIAAATYAAYGVLGLPAGVYVDRWPRRKVMLVTDAGRAIALGLVPLLWSLGLLRMWQLYAVAFVVGVLSLFFDVAYQAYLPAIVSRDKLIAGNARLQATTSATQVTGPGIAGIAVQLFGASMTLILDAASYVVSFVTLLSIRGRPETHERASGGEPLRRQMAEGFAYIRQDTILFSFLGCIGQLNFVIAAEEALFVIFLVRSVHVRPALVGILLAAQGVGAILGAISAQRLARRLGTGRAMVIGATLGPLLGLFTPFTAKGLALACFVIGTGGLGASTTISKVVGGSYRQAIVPPHLLGRVVAIMRTLTWGPAPVGGLVAGVLGQMLGPRGALLVLAIAMVSAPLWLLLTPVWRMRDLAPEGGGA
jgi:MFS family permease